MKSLKQQNSQRIHFFKEEGIRKLCYFFLLEIFADVVSMFKIKSSKKRLFTLFYSSFSGWSCCIIYCLSHLENRSWFVWGYYSNNANKCTWNQYYRFTQPLFHSSWGDWWSKNLKRMNTFLIGSLFFLGGEQQIFPNFPENNFWKIQGRKINFILFFL